VKGCIGARSGLTARDSEQRLLSLFFLKKIGGVINLKVLNKIFNIFLDSNEIVEDFPQHGYRYVKSTQGKVYIVITDNKKYHEYTNKLKKQLVRL